MPFAVAAMQWYVAGTVKPENATETNVVEAGDVEKQCEGVVGGTFVETIAGTKSTGTDGRHLLSHIFIVILSHADSYSVYLIVTLTFSGLLMSSVIFIDGCRICRKPCESRSQRLRRRRAKADGMIMACGMRQDADRCENPTILYILISYRL